MKEAFLKVANKLWVLKQSGIDVTSLRSEYIDKDLIPMELYEDFHKYAKEKLSENTELDLGLIQMILCEYILDKLAEKHNIDFDKELKNLEEDIQKSIKFENLESENIRNYILN